MVLAGYFMLKEQLCFKPFFKIVINTKATKEYFIIWEWCGEKVWKLNCSVQFHKVWTFFGKALEEASAAEKVWSLVLRQAKLLNKGVTGPNFINYSAITSYSMFISTP